MIDASQVKAARALIGMTQEELAKAAGLSGQTVKRMESVGTERSSAGNVLLVQKALEAAGVQFIPENGGGAGVRLIKPKGT
ncbi:helix-turn-helix transcriptional regulator [Rhizobium leguminosarum]|uniref:helix-turn-helix transcriptional regulator n=1 Tax=Rhizobium leguminosarum TaxID=384 RepID=UPI001031B4A0|nr:helix-turn-helix domain-containing protein [Rhizobium leguminosarum]MBB4505996.1 transcriptional regulator with XRE-family HTH domain [Rhizobium leguminosarum]NKK41697.1 helix-turn-helix domain-containing protein [Rhizobium leguminosarum bv. viciae]TBH39273.1 XRE family transcriptional regulator [Rhizobium leguminosarum]TBZ00414.1 XRE family transcriptional regulator [Rhizobium leguminosarum bv. viciae]TCB05210.1 XRE family transcriptional regulator [Rhizobium leguminosarum bv. viciae]